VVVCRNRIRYRVRVHVAGISERKPSIIGGIVLFDGGLIGMKNEISVWNIGKNYFIRTVTLHFTGKLVAVTDKELVLVDAAWIADTGRFSQFVKGDLQSSVEIEPYPDKEKVIVCRGGIIDAIEWKHSLPRTQR